MEGEAGQPREDSLGPFIPLLGSAGNAAPFHCDEGELAGNEERVDDEKERDDGQSDEGANWSGPGRSLAAENTGQICHTGFVG